MQNTTLRLIMCLWFILTAAWGNDTGTEQANPWKAPPPVFSDAVLRAKVLSTAVTPQPDGGTLTVEVISPPAEPAAVEVPTPAPLKTVSGLTGKIRLPAPAKLKLFSVEVTLYKEKGISRISWWGGKEPMEYSAFVRQDLSSINACGDVEKNGNRYLLFPVIRSSSGPLAPKENPPLLTDFHLDSDIILTKGDASDASAMEPLMALLEKYDREGGLIIAAAAAMKADQEARAAWEAAHPAKPENVVIKMWPVQSTEYSTKPVK